MFNTLHQRLTQLIQPHCAQQLAKEHGWCKRQAKISPFEFLFSALGQSSALNLTLNAQAAVLSQPVSRQAIDQRYNRAASAFFKAAFQNALAQSLIWKTDSPMVRGIQQCFKAVRIFDSTQCHCADALAKIFPASGGGGGPAGLKMLLSYEYATGQLHPLELLPANSSDQGLAEQAAQQVGPGELGLFDKGFYKAHALGSIQERGGSFVIPWPHGVKVYEFDAAGQRKPEPLNVAAALQASTQPCVEWNGVELGQSSTSRLGPLRLVAYRLPEENASRRRAQLREKYRTKGRQPTAQALELAGWLILLTNAAAALLPTRALSYVYRVRWQIELVFKQCKGVLRLDVLPSQNEHRVRCEVWARLLTALLTFLWYQHTNAACLQWHGREISFAKVARLLQQEGHTLASMLFTRRERSEIEFRRLWNKLLKLARKERQPSRPTTWENLCTFLLPVPNP